MTLVAFSPSRLGPQPDLHQFERLAVNLSSSFSRLEADDVDDVVARAVGEIGAAFGADECTLIAFGERGAARVVQSWAANPQMPSSDDDVASMPWLVQRLARNAVVAMTPSSDIPHAAAKDREHAARTGIASRLAVPVALGARVAYGLVVGSRQRHSQWAAPVVERLRLMGEILGSGLERLRHDEARASLADGERLSASADAVYLSEEARNQREADQIIGESGALRLALTRLSQVAPLDATVLLLGETGTGKELFARAIHDRSRRRERTLIRVNCAALPASLIESELFGHERGAFTGAISMRQGRFELADGGTIFLDEIGDLAPELQAKILRALQEGEFERVGSSKTRRVDVRVIAATNRDLEKDVAEGRFRADLYYRLGVFPIALPTLRERPEDIPQLVWFFIHRHQRELGRRITRVPAAVMQALQRHDWPGNIRELENVVERAMIRSVDGTLQLDDPLRTESRARLSRECGDTLDAVQRLHIEKVLKECGGRINGTGNAAVRLGIHPNTLRSRIKRLGVVLPRRPTTFPSSSTAGRA
ncbi:MAG TPA: sigma 54-interacting transcriptional regulator [Vicinamibacterales bacterium]